jgi:protein-tyrosine phosphatase
MAEALFRRSLRDARVMSAGVNAMPGLGADPRAIDSVRCFGIDLRAHRSQPLAYWMLEASDLVLTMSERQRREIVARYPTAMGRVFRLLDDEDVADPYERSNARYAATVDKLVTGVERWSARLTRVSHSTYSWQDHNYESA